MVDVNIKGVLYGIAAALPRFQTQKSGHLVNVSSVAGHVVFPLGAVYCGTKFAVRAIAEGFRQESGPTIRSTIISPGAVKSELIDQITDAGTAETIKPLTEIAIEADAIARAVAFASEQPPMSMSTRSSCGRQCKHSDAQKGSLIQKVPRAPGITHKQVIRCNSERASGAGLCPRTTHRSSSQCFTCKPSAVPAE
jgi:hypothetical protein